MTQKDITNRIIEAAIKASLPKNAVRKTLRGISFADGKIITVAVGKAAWAMASAANEAMPDRIRDGIIITKYAHSRGPVANMRIFEAGHPVPDENSYRASEEALKTVSGLCANDTVLFLLSGGGSALFEKPLIDSSELADITRQMLRAGAGIVEMNTVRKRLSAVKGGRFALQCAPAKIKSIILSDILGDPPGMIASGPAYPDESTCAEAMEIVSEYGLKLSDKALECLRVETPKELGNVETHIAGSVRILCAAALRECKALGYDTQLLTTALSCEAREAGAFIAAIAQEHASDEKKLAYVLGGESVVHVQGSGKGGRNQELALSAALGIEGLENVCIFSVGSDGTDGPTDAAGGVVFGHTARDIRNALGEGRKYLLNNDSYTALAAVGALLITGPTNTNVNDLTVLLIN